VIANTRPIQT